ncbi:unnamed protein product, partial [marine sediment metagenome]
SALSEAHLRKAPEAELSELQATLEIAQAQYRQLKLDYGL